MAKSTPNRSLVWLARLATLKPCRAVFHLQAPLTVRLIRRALAMRRVRRYLSCGTGLVGSRTASLDCPDSTGCRDRNMQSVVRNIETLVAAHSIDMPLVVHSTDIRSPGHSIVREPR